MLTIEFKNLHIGEIKDLSLDELSKLLENIGWKKKVPSLSLKIINLKCTIVIHKVLNHLECSYKYIIELFKLFSFNISIIKSLFIVVFNCKRLS